MGTATGSGSARGKRMRQITISLSDAVYEHVMFFLKKIDKTDIKIKEVVQLSLAEK